MKKPTYDRAKSQDYPTYEEVIDAIADLPFPCYHGKDRDGVIEIHIPIAKQWIKEPTNQE